MSAPPRLGILGMGTCLPTGVRTNEDVARAAGVTPEWITQRTGVRNRHLARPGEAASDLGSTALKAALAAASVAPEQIALLITATSTPDEVVPSTACRIQANTRCRGAAAFDVGAACSGWVFAAKLACDWLRASGSAQYAAVVAVDLYSKYIDPAERKTASLFSDGAAAAVIGPAAHGFDDFQLFSDGALAEHFVIPAGGSRMPPTEETIRAGSHHVRMNGRGLTAFMNTVFPQTIDLMLARGSLTLDDIALVVAHQPNPVLLSSLGEACGIPPEKLHITGNAVGNLGVASAPYTLADAASQGLIRRGDRLLMGVFGAGATWAGTMLTWNGASTVHVH
ncbi:3-oxoacyl-ACP synthase III family protein [Streptomyces sp. NPDC057654]|uniref:3-oxoacyl-ACP synthase III family protein n=1 Tax=Streptomyces sp. NPDC057654 TaxID=3346196 RepID=UPI0036793113